MPLHGQNGLYAVAQRADVYLLAKNIGINTGNSHILDWARGFIAVCLITTFLSLSLVLSDVLSDGLHLSKRGKSGIIVYALTFLPPIIIVIFIPKLFLVGVNYAGLCAIVYVYLLPCFMIYSARYVKHMIPKNSFAVFGHKPIIYISTIIGFILFIFGISNIF